MFTRRTATVIISAPDASCALTMTACDEYLPVPTISRDVNVLPAMVNGVGSMTSSTAADEVHDLDLVPVVDHRRFVGGAPHDKKIVFDRDTARVDFEMGQKAAHGNRSVELVPVAVQHDRNALSVARSANAPQ